MFHYCVILGAMYKLSYANKTQTDENNDDIQMSLQIS